MGFTSEDVMSMWKLLAIILHLGNLTFEVSGDSLSLKNDTISIDTLADMMGLDLQNLRVALTVQRILAGKRGSGEQSMHLSMTL